MNVTIQYASSTLDIICLFYFVAWIGLVEFSYGKGWMLCDDIITMAAQTNTVFQGCPYYTFYILNYCAFTLYIGPLACTGTDRILSGA